MGADHYQRSRDCTARRNGHRPKTVSMTVGDVEAQIPNLWAGPRRPTELLYPE
ncbi:MULTISPECIES: transposase [Mycolicibacter]|uniref:transposase n=1 Tax=Mycolicibacter heraklionensis TaxID=512402 RepID=UPI000D693289|nr:MULTISPECIES: transposase [Mycolicibacter]ULP49701.1 transposase [Mycolicibacter virginiensis]